MAKCYLQSAVQVQEAVVDESLEITYPATFYGSDISNESMQQNIKVVILETDSIAQEKTKVVNALIARAAELGGVLTASRIRMPVLQKGS